VRANDSSDSWRLGIALGSPVGAFLEVTGLQCGDWFRGFRGRGPRLRQCQNRRTAELEI
jgi:hypothetical protein